MHRGKTERALHEAVALSTKGKTVELMCGSGQRPSTIAKRIAELVEGSGGDASGITIWDYSTEPPSRQRLGCGGHIMSRLETSKV